MWNRHDLRRFTDIFMGYWEGTLANTLKNILDLNCTYDKFSHPIYGTQGNFFLGGPCTYPFLQLIQYIQVVIGSTSPDMTKIFYVQAYGRFTEIKGILRGKKLQKKKSNSNNERAPILKQKRMTNPAFSEMIFHQRLTHPLSQQHQLTEQSNETSWVFLALKSTSHLLLQSTVL